MAPPLPPPRARSPRRGPTISCAAIDLELQLTNIKWLVANRCDLGQPLGLLETNLRAVADSDRITQFADKLAALRPARP